MSSSPSSFPNPSAAVIYNRYVRIVNPIAVLGEDAACKFLVKKGYKIVERNFRKGYGEIDVIAHQNGTLVFVEVKTRTSSLYGSPFEAISPFKLKSIIKAAQFYAYVFRPKKADNIRIDAIGVWVKNGSVVKIEHLEGIT